MQIPEPAYLHFRSVFDVVPLEEKRNPWEDLIYEIIAWLESRIPARDAIFDTWFIQGGEWESPDSQYKIQVERANGSLGGDRPQYWALRLEEPCSKYPRQRRRRVDIAIWVVETFRYGVCISSSYFERPGYIGKPPPISLAVPEIVQILVDGGNWRTFAGSEELVSKPKQLDVGDVGEFKEFLGSANRLCPVVYVSCDPEIGRPLVNTTKLAQYLAGNAIVIGAESSELDQEIKELFEDQFTCWGGASRVYFPKVDFNSEADSRRHRFFPAEEIKIQPEITERILIRSLMRQSLSFTQPEIVSVIDVTAKSRRMRIRKLTKEARRSTKEWEREFDRLEDEIEKLELEKRALEEKKNELEHSLDEKESKIDYFKHEKDELIKSANEKGISKDIELAFEKLKFLPNSPSDIIEITELIHKDRIAFTERARKSANSLKKPNVSVYWNILWQMATILPDLFFVEEEEKPRDPKKAFKDRAGLILVMTEGPQTKKSNQFMNLRNDIYKGQPITIEPHVKKAGDKNSRVYFHIHKEKELIVVGHLGHLENYSTQFLS
jgi:hypothetical protein